MHLSGVALDRRQDPDTTDGNGNGSPIPPSGSSSDSSITLTPTSSPTPTSTASASPTPSSSSKSQDSTRSPTVAIVIGTIAALLGLSIAVYFLLRLLRQKHRNPKYVPTPFLKRHWTNWNPTHSRSRLPDTDHLEPISATRLSRSSASPSFNVGAQGNIETGDSSRRLGPASTPATAQAATVDRNTSVRSVMTLPAYNPDPLQHEQILAREGERGGIDIVIEFPETVDEEEQSRQQEMDALYQVRLARRRENEEREERRTLRREARERGDYVALRELQNRPRGSSTASTGQTVEELRAEHDRIKRERQRAVSSVSYADLGVARHDGTRIRASSVESEREGLLGDAASIAASSHYHRRDRSASSVLSIDTTSDLPSPGLSRSRAYSRPDSPLRRASGVGEDGATGEGGAGSSPEIIDHDDLPLNSPPGYENIPLETSNGASTSEPPPDYTSPIAARGEHRELFFSSANDSESRERRTSATNFGQPGSDALSATRPVSGEHRSSRGVGGIPQLPSLRLGNLPSIAVDPASPRLEHVTEENPHSR